MARATVNVKQIVNTLHNKLRYAKTAEEKRGICTCIEEILHSTGNYRGFGYNLSQAQWKYLYDNKLFINDAIAMGWLTEYDRTYA